MQEEILAEITRIELEIEKNARKGGFGRYVNNRGEVVTYFSCFCNEEQMFRGEYLLELYRVLKDQEPLYDPNKIDTRRVRKELKDKFVNLGMRVNRISSRAIRI